MIRAIEFPNYGAKLFCQIKAVEELRILAKQFGDCVDLDILDPDNTGNDIYGQIFGPPNDDACCINRISFITSNGIEFLWKLDTIHGESVLVSQKEEVEFQPNIGFFTTYLTPLEAYALHQFSKGEASKEAMKQTIGSALNGSR